MFVMAKKVGMNKLKHKYPEKINQISAHPEIGLFYWACVRHTEVPPTSTM
jgi:hypothetical protein